MAVFTEFKFGAADPAASVPGALLLPLGMPDLTDVPGYVLPLTGEIVGVAAACNPATGDTVKVKAAAIAAGSPVILVPSIETPAIVHVATAPAVGVVMLARGQGSKRLPGDIIGCLYATTTSGAYTVNDITATVLVAHAENL